MSSDELLTYPKQGISMPTSRRTRSKVHQTLEDVIRAELARRVTITIRGKKRSVAALDAILYQLRLKALEGNQLAWRLLAPYVFDLYKSKEVNNPYEIRFY